MRAIFIGLALLFLLIGCRENPKKRNALVTDSGVGALRSSHSVSVIIPEGYHGLVGCGFEGFVSGAAEIGGVSFPKQKRFAASSVRISKHLHGLEVEYGGTRNVLHIRGEIELDYGDYRFENLENTRVVIGTVMIGDDRTEFFVCLGPLVEAIAKGEN
ncbi:MAG: hypothetical protein ACSHYB_11405 [Roseibacillus sp.]